MKLYVSFWEAGRTEVAKDIINNIREVQALYDKYKFLNAIRPERKQHIHNPYSASFHAWLYYRLNIIEDSPEKVFDEDIMSNMPANVEDEHILNDRNDTLKDYLKIMLDSHPTQLAEVFDKFTPAIKIELLKMLASIDRLKVLVETKEIHDKILAFVNSYDSKINKNNYFVLFYKKYFSIQLTEDEQEFLRLERNEIAQERDMEWEANKLFINFATIAYALDEYTFEKQLERKPSSYYHGNAYSERVVIAMLYSSYISLLKGEVEFEYIYRQYAKYCELNGDTRFKAQALQYTVAKLWALIYGHSTTDSSVKKLLVKRLVNELRILKYPFYLHLNRSFPVLFAEITNEGDVEIFENELQSWDDDFQTKVDKYLQISLMYRTLNPKKASELFIKAMVDGTLRHGWRKDPIVHYDLVYSLGLILKKQWLQGADADKTIKEVYELVIRAYEISDGSGTSRGPYRFIEVIAKYDSDIAATYKDEYVKHEGKSNISNAIFTPIILSKVRMGLAIEQIEAHFDEFYVSYDYEGAPHADYYEQMFVVYLEIARSQLYPNEDRKAALDKANELIIQMEKENVRYYLSDTDFASEKKEFVKLCKEFDINPEIDSPKKTSSYSQSHSAAKEHAFQLELSQAKSLRKIKGAYKKLGNYKNGIYLKEDLSWQLLITKTIDFSGDISPFIEYLKSLNYPHSDYYSNNSEYIHHGVAHALSTPTHKQQMLDYLYDNGGHGGFHNMIKVYIQLNDRKMALGLLDRYIQLCKLLTT
jgi:hypothetical protein